MPINRIAASSLLLVPLAACGSKPTVDERNVSVEQVANDIRDASKAQTIIRPGEWQSTVTIEDVAMPGMPAGIANQMKKSMARARTSSTCVTAEEAGKPRFFAASDQCRYDHFTMGGGKIDAEMHCTQNGMTQDMQMSGTYSADTYTMQMTSNATGPANAGNMTMKMKVDAKRIGDCTGKSGSGSGS